MKPLIIYHKDCPDGFGSAYAAWKLFGDEAEYLPKQHGEPVPDVSGRNVFMLDFSYKRPIIEKLRSQAEDLTIVDHHVTAQKELEGMPNCTFDMEHSGAYLSWQHFHPGKKVPLFIQYLEDRDLWKFRLPKSDEITLATMAYPYDFKEYDKMCNASMYTPEAFQNIMAAEGQVIIRYRDMQIERMMQHVIRKDYEFHGKKVNVPTVNCPLFQSDVGAVLSKGEPFSEMWYKTDGKTIYSLRSDPNGMDVSQIAKSFGGGGHKNAAGYEIKDEEGGE